MTLLKKIPRPVKIIIGMILLHSFVIVFTVELYNASKPVLIEDCIQETIVVEEKYSKWGRTTTSYRIRYKDRWFVLDTPARSSRYSSSEVYDMLSVGEELDIFYTTRSWVLLPIKSNLIVDARNSKEIYLEFDEEHQESQTKGLDIFVLVVGIVSEGGAIAITVTLINWNRALRKKENEEKNAAIEKNNTTT